MQTPCDLGESLLVLALLIAAAMLGDRWMPNWRSAASRLLSPWEFVPSVGSVEITQVTPGNVEVLPGESVDIAALVRNPGRTPHTAVLVLMGEDGRQSTQAMACSTGFQPVKGHGQDGRATRYHATISCVLRPLRYRLEIGDSQTPLYTVSVGQRPAVEGLEVTYRYPAYLGRRPETLQQRELDLEAPQYTVVDLKFRLSAPVAHGSLQSGNEVFPGHVEEGGRRFIASMPLLRSGSYSVRLVGEAGRVDPGARLNRITVLPDQPPQVELVHPAAQSSAPPRAQLPVVVRASDDHGLGQIELQMKIEGEKEADVSASNGKPEGGPDAPADSESVIVVKQWTDFPGDGITNAVRRYRLPLPEAARPGQAVLIRAVARDKRLLVDGGLDLGPQESATPWHEVKIVAPEAASKAAMAQLDGLRDAIWKLLEKQLQARSAAAALKVDTRKVPVGATPPTAGGETGNQLSDADSHAVADIRGSQIEIQRTAADLARPIASADGAEPRAVRRALGALALGEMLEAVARCDEMLKLKSSAGFAAPLRRLAAAQDHIIEVLRKLLDLTRRAAAELSADEKKRPGNELPDDLKRKFEELRQKLEKFLAQQKKVIEASENLAKKPVEDFSKQEEELLRGLAAAEEDLAKFMGEVQSDLSKLPEQDFANPSTAKEIVEVQTELKMAADALTKKSVEIAVPLEQLGYERAEELKTNLEKWLPDTPDREKWSQEESLSDKDKEAPMAELPGELEDLVGELMEQEEDLMDEAEDVSSSAADSLDKGAGWDAMDGPISDMSGKGVTGNRLPNGSEIGGRSGEGRQGKSSGEFVGDEAVGKGGRRTPSRLTPDPIVKGRIKDRNKQAPGGATGGGKESGQGGEGLQGPVPKAARPRDAGRLADRQATLRNQAEGLDLRFQVLSFHHTDLKKLVEAMAQVEQDLRSGHYRNALRERDVLLEGFRNVKQYLEGEAEVRQDASSNLPTDVQKKILGAMQEASPPGWEELNRRYFERLSGEGGEKRREKRAEKGEGTSRPATPAEK
jgi:hypothetical protein